MEPMVKDSTIAWTVYSAVVRIHSSDGGSERLFVGLVYFESCNPAVGYMLFAETCIVLILILGKRLYLINFIFIGPQKSLTR